ncbi:hypothetical protein DY000_02029446 [Brassica cretica]|uniref:Transmembrane protein n=1 Tax=Brassica cretica TaxID=69181 RepID=A0ABQ7DDE8_BRACR|nr:hypothetical protein DY000_02029446 [Brassica cretica]
MTCLKTFFLRKKEKKNPLSSTVLCSGVGGALSTPNLRLLFALGLCSSAPARYARWSLVSRRLFSYGGLLMRVYHLRWSSVSGALARTASEAQFESPAFRVREPSRSRFPFCRSVPVLDDLVARGCVGRLLCSGSVLHFQISLAAKFRQSGATARESLPLGVLPEEPQDLQNLGDGTCGSVARWFCVGSSMSPAISCRSCFLFDLLRSRHSVSCGSSQLVRVSSSASDLVLSSLPVVSLVRSTLGQSSGSQRLSMCVSPVHPIVVGISWVSELAGFVLSSVVGLGWVRAKDWCRQSLLGSCREYLYSERRRETRVSTLKRRRETRVCVTWRRRFS